MHWVAGDLCTFRHASMHPSNSLLIGTHAGHISHTVHQHKRVQQLQMAVMTHPGTMHPRSPRTSRSTKGASKVKTTKKLFWFSNPKLLLGLYKVAYFQVLQRKEGEQEMCRDGRNIA